MIVCDDIDEMVIFEKLLMLKVLFDWFMWDEIYELFVLLFNEFVNN